MIDSTLNQPLGWVCALQEAVVTAVEVSLIRLINAQSQVSNVIIGGEDITRLEASSFHLFTFVSIYKPSTLIESKKKRRTRRRKNNKESGFVEIIV